MSILCAEGGWRGRRHKHRLGAGAPLLSGAALATAVAAALPPPVNAQETPPIQLVQMTPPTRLTAPGQLAQLAALVQAPRPAQLLEVDIPPGPLAEALNRFALRAGVALVMDAALLQGRRSPGLQGAVGVEEGFQRLLDGSGYRIQPTPAGYMLVPALPFRSEASEDQERKEGAESSPRILPSFPVIGNRLRENPFGYVPGYGARRFVTATAGGADIAIADLPQAATVVTRDLIEDQAATRLEDLTVNVPGIQPIAPYVGIGTIGFNVRGFTGGRYLYNGFRTQTYQPLGSLANVERIEYLRGPSSALYGITGIDGVANIVTKRPGESAGDQVSVAFDRFGQRRFSADLDTANPDAAIKARINLTAEDSDTFRDFVRFRELFVAPSLLIAPDRRSEILLETTHQHLRFNADRGFSLGGLPALFIRQGSARSNIISDPELGYSRSSFDSISVRASHELNDAVKLHVAARHHRYAVLSAPEIYATLNPDGRTVDRLYLDYPGGPGNRSTQSTLLAQLSASFSSGTVQHQLLFGSDYERSKQPYDAISSQLASVDFYSPVYPDGIRPTTNFRYRGTLNDSFINGVYLQDMLMLTPVLKLLVGWRRDQYEIRNAYADPFGNNVDSISGSKSSGRAGVVWQLAAASTLYASLAEAFKPNVGQGVNGTVLPPEISRSLEVGFKHDLAPGLHAGAALFQIHKKNVLAADPANPQFGVVSGRQLSAGAEVELRGRIDRRTSLVLAASHLFDYRVVSDTNPDMVADKLLGAAANSFSMWARHRLAATGAHGWSLGAGIVYAGKRDATLPNAAYRLPAFTRIDAGLYYDQPRWSVQLSARNLTDRLILRTNDGPGLVVPDEPRNLRLILTFRL